MTTKEKMLAVAKKALYRLARLECGTITSAQLAQGALSEMAGIKVKAKAKAKMRGLDY